MAYFETPDKAMKMKLYFSNPSPYARKARMTIIEKGLNDRVEQVLRNPFDDPADLRTVNPLGKVPVLILPDGQALYDSAVICEYLDTLSETPSLMPIDSKTRWQTLRRSALTDGILDAAVSLVMERRRPAEERSEHWRTRWEAAILRSVAVANSDIAGFSGGISLDQIGLGAALGYLDLRIININWRRGNPDLSDWFDQFSQRPSMQQTMPLSG